MNLAVPNLPVADLLDAKRFFVDLLGFTVLWEWSEDGHSGILGLEREGMRINLDSPMDGHGKEVCVSLEVKDIDSLYEEWSKVVSGVSPPKLQDWGGRTFGFQDPDNNAVFVLSSIGG